MKERVLVVNAGSSSLKLSVLTADGTAHAATTLERWEGRTHLDPLRRFLDEAGEIDAVGHRVMTAAAGGVDLLVMTGGIGEYAPLVRVQVAARLAYLGVRIDADANERTTADGDISSAGAPARTVVVAAREDLEITRRTAALLAADPTPA